MNAITFSSFANLVDENKQFIAYHNSQHRYSSQGHKTPEEVSNLHGQKIHYNANTHELKNIPLITGVVYFIRFIRSDLKLHLVTEDFNVDESLKYSYVVAEVNLDTQSLIVRQNSEIIHVFPYLTPVDW